LGMVDLSESTALGFMQIVRQWDAATFLPIIKLHAVIHSDQWASYNAVGSLPNVSAHKTVTSTSLQHQSSGILTLKVVSYWYRVGVKLKRMRGCAELEIPDKFMWYECFWKTSHEALDVIIHDSAQ